MSGESTCGILLARSRFDQGRTVACTIPTRLPRTTRPWRGKTSPSKWTQRTLISSKASSRLQWRLAILALSLLAFHRLPLTAWWLLPLLHLNGFLRHWRTPRVRQLEAPSKMAMTMAASLTILFDYYPEWVWFHRWAWTIVISMYRLNFYFVLYMIILLSSFLVLCFILRL